VDFLYPDGNVPEHVGMAQLRVPARVGLTFLPAAPGEPGLDASQRQEILARVRAAFETRDYVKEIVVIPDYNLGSGGFDSLQQLARLQQLDVLALVSYDQVSRRSENEASLLYWTILGYYVVHGSEHETNSLMDLAVVDPVSRTLILRAGGTSFAADRSAAVDQQDKLQRQQRDGFKLASNQLIANLDAELQQFRERVRQGTAPVQVVHSSDRGGGGGGAVGLFELASLCCLLVCGARPRKSRQVRVTC
jgi:rhombotail lipoprotein